MITIDDIRKAGHCPAGTRRWFAAQRLDFAKFLREGISTEEFLATGDPLAVNVVKRKAELAARG